LWCTWKWLGSIHFNEVPNRLRLHRALCSHYLHRLLHESLVGGHANLKGWQCSFTNMLKLHGSRLHLKPCIGWWHAWFSPTILRQKYKLKVIWLINCLGFAFLSQVALYSMNVMHSHLCLTILSSFSTYVLHCFNSNLNPLRDVSQEQGVYVRSISRAGCVCLQYLKSRVYMSAVSQEQGIYVHSISRAGCICPQYLKSRVYMSAVSQEQGVYVRSISRAGCICLQYLKSRVYMSAVLLTHADCAVKCSPEHCS